MATETGSRVAAACATAGLSQRALADETGISQSTLSRIISGDREAKLPELVAIAWATGRTLPELTGTSTVAQRVECAARATNGSPMEAMRAQLLQYLELDAYLEDQGIPPAS